MINNYVNPFFGNGEMDLKIKDDLCKRWFFLKAQCGNTHPGASLPFSMITAVGYSGGYPTGYGTHRNNTHGQVDKIMENLKINGFTHFHPSGTGAIQKYYNFIKLIPVTTELDDVEVFEDVKSEEAGVGYYQTTLEQSGTQCELTVTKGAAVHQYTFADKGRVLVDITCSGLHKSLDGRFHGIIQSGKVTVDKNTVSGYILTDGIKLYYAILLPEGSDISLLKGTKRVEDKNLEFDNNQGLVGVSMNNYVEKCPVYVGFSLLNEATAKDEAIKASEKGFNKVKKEAEALWEKYLGGIVIETKDEQLKNTFYSSLFHAIHKPATMNEEAFMDFNPNFYLDFATLWDQYKTQLPLVLSLYKDQGAPIVNTLIDVAERIKDFPIAILMCDDMEKFIYQARFLSVYVITDAYNRGVQGIDYHKALDLIMEIFFADKNKDFIQDGFTERYTHILDTADACYYAGKMAIDLGREQDGNKLLAYTNRWINAYDCTTGLLSPHSKYYEGTLYNYSFRLQHNMEERIALIGGDEAYVMALDSFFGYGKEEIQQPKDPSDRAYMKFGESLHRFEGFNNEPDMETPYNYNYVNRHDRTCEIVRKSVRSMFHNGKGGLPGNDDSGGITSCYVWNVTGLFPVPGQQRMLIGSPSVDKATFNLYNGQTFIVEPIHNSDENIYVKKIILNGVPIERLYITMDEYMQGGKLQLHMGTK